MARFKLTAQVTSHAKPTPTANAWRKTPERIAEELRQIAHAQTCAKATANPRIFRDPFKADFEGQFRLAPVPRGRGHRRSSEEVLATTPDYMERYEYDATPVTKMTGFNAPVTIWPAEFRAAVMVEVGEQNSQICHTVANEVRPVPRPDSDAKMQSGYVPQYQGMGPGLCLINQTQGRDDSVEGGADYKPP